MNTVSQNATSTKTPFTKKVGTLVTLDVVSILTDNYTVANEGKEGVVDSIYFGKDQIQNLLDQSGAEGIRIHFGLTNKGEQKIIIFPADSFGKNINVKNSDGTDSGLDMGLPCPTLCPLV